MEKRLRQGRSLCERSRSERHLLRLSLNRRGFAHLLFLDAGELADGIRLDLPSLEWQGDLALAFAELLLEGAADERACEVDMSPLRSLDAAYSPRPFQTTTRCHSGRLPKGNRMGRN